ncbi:MAG: hypothetical protein WBA63_04855 [Thermomicrobiales bacterium]
MPSAAFLVGRRPRDHCDRLKAHDLVAERNHTMTTNRVHTTAAASDAGPGPFSAEEFRAILQERLSDVANSARRMAGSESESPLPGSQCAVITEDMLRENGASLDLRCAGAIVGAMPEQLRWDDPRIIGEEGLKLLRDACSIPEEALTFDLDRMALNEAVGADSLDARTVDLSVIDRQLAAPPTAPASMPMVDPWLIERVHRAAVPITRPSPRRMPPSVDDVIAHVAELRFLVSVMDGQAAIRDRVAHDEALARRVTEMLDSLEWCRDQLLAMTQEEG